jgi:hypothetical protein
MAMDFPMSPEAFAELRKRAGIPEDHISGIIERQRVMAHWSYADGVLSGTIVKKPWLLPDALVWLTFRKWAGIRPAP